jgi:hypothetical protein
VTRFPGSYRRVDVGRHCGSMDGRTEGMAFEVVHGPTSTRSAVEVARAQAAHRHGGQPAHRLEEGPSRSRTAVADPFWDESPVPPPVVVASADRRTPAVTFAPDADPFSAGGLFAPGGGRDGEPSVVVHPAPDATVARAGRRPRSLSSAAARTGEPAGLGSLDRSFDDTLDTGSLVRPYVPEVQLDVQPEGQADVLPEAVLDPRADVLPEAVLDPRVRSDTWVAPPAEPSATVLPRRPRRVGGPLDRIVEPAPTAGTWSAPWSRENEEDQAGRSLFQPAALREPDGIWATPREQTLPSRKALRAQERAGSVAGLPGITGSDLSTRVTGRRIAKSGVLAVTAMGVVAASAPNAFPALAWRLPAQPAAQGAQAAAVGLPAVDALAVAPALAAPARTAGDLPLATSDAQPQRKVADEAAAARAGAAATGTGRSFVDLARQQVLAELTRKRDIADRASRNVVRDPRSYARLLVQQRGWSASQFTCLNLLWTKESGWDYRATNRSSGAYGIPQSLPGSKMASVAADWRTNPVTQIRWGLNYIASVYGTPCGAWAHSQRTNWY